MFVDLFEKLLEMPTEYSLLQTIGQIVSLIALGKQADQTTEFEISRDNLERLRFHLEALGLIRTAVTKGQYTSAIIWEITERGRRYVSQLRAIPNRSID